MKILFGFLLSILFFTNCLAQQPNVLWIITDDQRLDSNGVYNRTTRGTNDSELGYVESPNIDALATEGVFFTNTYCNSPACAPSRGSIITGKYLHHAGLYGFEQTHNKPDFFTPTLPEIMSDQGYQTSMFGKSGYYIFEWGPGLTWNNAGFYGYNLDFKNDLNKHGITDYFSRTMYEKIDGKTKKIGSQLEFYYPNGDHKFYFMERAFGDITQEDIDNRAFVENDLDLLYAYTRSNSTLIIGGVSSMPEDKTVDARIVEEFTNHLQNQDKDYLSLSGKTVSGPSSSQAQFISLSFHLPHTPVLPPKLFRDRFKDKVYYIPEFSSDELNKLPTQLRTIYDKMKIDGLSYDEKQQAIRDYYAFCAYGDHLIGEAVDEFKAYSKRNNQEYLIMYVCGDHGWHLGEQGIEAKFAPWQLSNHCSAIVVSSNPTTYPAGTVYDGFTEFVDIAPTFIKAAGANISDHDYLDGNDWSEMINNPDLNKDYVLGEINQVAGPNAFIRSTDFSFSMRNRKQNGRPGSSYPPNDNIKWGLEAPRDDVEMALYDLRIDPNERNNVANDTEYIELADWFRVKLANIVLGDGRIECDWSQENEYAISDFAVSSDDKQLNIPANIIPNVELVDIEEDFVKLKKDEDYQLSLSSNSASSDITWMSNDVSVATVNNEGKVTCLSNGSCGIVAKLANGASDICIINSEQNDVGISNVNMYFKVFPNPSSNSFRIKTENNHWDSITIINSNGHLIESIKNNNRAEFSIGQDWSSGTYILTLQTDNAQYNQKVIKL